MITEQNFQKTHRQMVDAIPDMTYPCFAGCQCLLEIFGILCIVSLTSKDIEPEEGPLFNANVFGTACTEVELDVLTGTYIIQRMDIIYDCGTRYGVHRIIKFLSKFRVCNIWYMEDFP